MDTDMILLLLLPCFIRLASCNEVPISLPGSLRGSLVLAAFKPDSSPSSFGNRDRVSFPGTLALRPGHFDVTEPQQTQQPSRLLLSYGVLESGSRQKPYCLNGISTRIGWLTVLCYYNLCQSKPEVCPLLSQIATVSTEQLRQTTGFSDEKIHLSILSQNRNYPSATFT